MKFTELTISNPNDLIFGVAPKPVLTKRGLLIGGGLVYPELNFTLPPVEVSKNNLAEVRSHYSEIVTGALIRAVDLNSEGLILEFETVVEMTLNPDIGVELVRVMNDICEDFHARFGLKSEIRLTPNDLRDFDRPPRQRTSKYLDPMMELFERGALAGGDLLSIESTGGKELSDDALMMCDIRQFIFTQAVLGVRDMQMLWSKIVALANKLDKIPGGDTACAFGNTAMVLAEKKFIPKVFAAIARVATVTRSLVAYEQGAKGPNKDCGYEGPYLKAIAGIPISMEGKNAACAHFSPVGNITAACADLWSNESVQNIKLLAGMAPTVSYEQLEYETRLMNAATKQGKASARILKSLYVDSDIFHDPQAFVLAPENVIDIAKEIVSGRNYLESTVKGCKKAISMIETAMAEGRLKNDKKEYIWIDKIRQDLETIPSDEGKFIEEMLPVIDTEKIILGEYGL
ncbi:MAG: methanol--corrinoid methyltransferase [Porphyromonadaceae bacterium]|nr:MAG: methanol--corrinoid methyltransferase [Porphyromonadaceae bacterium]